MKAFYKILSISAAVLLTCCLFSCGNKKGNASQQMLILGKWNLQQQHVVLLTDGVKTMDTVFNADAATNTYAYLVFNSNGTDSSRSVYNPANLNLQTNAPGASRASGMGTYSITNSTISGTFGVSAWYTFVTGSAGSPTLELPVYQITLLSTSNLDLQEHLSLAVTNNGTHTYQITNQFYFTK